VPHNVTFGFFHFIPVVESPEWHSKYRIAGAFISACEKPPTYEREEAISCFRVQQLQRSVWALETMHAIALEVQLFFCEIQRLSREE
jgi:hypothetical protein